MSTRAECFPHYGGGRMIESPNSASEVRLVPVRTADFRGVRRFFHR